MIGHILTHVFKGQELISFQLHGEAERQAAKIVAKLYGYSWFSTDTHTCAYLCEDEQTDRQTDPFLPMDHVSSTPTAMNAEAKR